MFELILTIFYVFIIALVALIIQYRSRSPHLKYLTPAIMFKILGGIAFGLIYSFYYGYGDTFVYFDCIKIYSEILAESPGVGLRILIGFHDLIFSHTLLNSNMHEIYFTGAGTLTIIKIGSFLQFLGLGYYFPTTIIFSIVAFIGQWKLFSSLCAMYPKIQAYLAAAVLFIPSVALWGSGIMKDGLSLGGICLVTGVLIDVFKNKKISIPKLVLSLFVLYLVFQIKGYIVVAFIPAVLFWLFYSFRSGIGNRVLRVIVYPLILALASGFSVLFGLYIGEIDERYSQQKAINQAITFQENHYNAEGTEEGTASGYNLGEYDPTLLGISSKFLPSVNVTLFRPYFWEVQNTVMLAAGLESFASLALLIFTLFHMGMLRFVNTLFDDPFLVFCLVFTLLFSFIVGFSSFNFGALVRYKIPTMIFYALLFLIPLGQYRKEKSKR